MTKVRLPRSLVAHAIWEPVNTGSAVRPVIYVSERRRRRVAVLVPPVALALVPFALLIESSPLILVSAALAPITTMISLAYAGGGRRGFYTVTEDGRLGDSLDRRLAQFSGLRRRRVNADDLEQL